MAAAEKELHREILMDDRIARLEVHAEHTQKNLVRLEAKVDKIDEKIETKTTTLEAKIDKLDEKIEKLDEKIGTHGKALAEFRIEVVKKLSEISTGRMAERVWLLLIGAALLGVMARSFRWI